MSFSNEQIARLAHETNRAFCDSIGDHSQRAWEDAAEWQRQSAIAGVEFRMSSHANGIVPSESAQHDAWLADKRTDGWKYGPVKNPKTKEHPCFVPYEALPIEQRMKDYLFAAIVDAFEKCNRAESSK